MKLPLSLATSIFVASGFVSSGELVWEPTDSVERQDEVVTAINQNDAGFSNDTKQEKYDNMAESAFAFYRGTAYVYHDDLNLEKMQTSTFYSSEAYSWSCGDLHIENYGSFDNNNENALMVTFDLNDFDTTAVANFLQDIWRASVSLLMVCQTNQLSTEDCKYANSNFTTFYAQQLDAFRNNDDEINFNWTATEAYGKLDDFLDDVEEDNSRPQMLDKYVVDGHFDYSSSKFEPVSADLYKEITESIAIYRDESVAANSIRGDTAYFAVKSIARRLHQGTGSLGLNRYYVLIEGETDASDDDRILDVKQQVASPMYVSMTDEEKDRTLDSSLVQGLEGARAALGNRAMLSYADNHIGNLTLTNGTESYSVKERSPYKDTLDSSILDSLTRITKLAQQYGIIVAAAHARSDMDFDPLIVPYQFEDQAHKILDQNHDEFADEVYNFAINYAQQVQYDYETFMTQVYPLYN